MTSASLTLRDVITRLAAEGDLSQQQHIALLADAALPRMGRSTAWFIQAFVAIGAWLAAVFFLVAVGLFLFITNSFQTATFNAIVLILGVVVVLAAVGIRRATAGSVFAINMALALSLAGQALLCSGIWLMSANLAATTLVAIGVVVALIVVYPDRLQRLLCTLAINCAVLVLCAEWHIPNAIHPLLWLLALGTVVFWERESFVASANRDDLLRPIGYGISIALLGTLGLALASPWYVWPSDWRVSTIGLLVLLLGYEYSILSRYGAQAHWRLMAGILIGTILVLLPTLQAPGVTAALLVFGVGFRRGNRILMGGAIAFLAGFLIMFYYNLELTLFWKSLILLSTGLLCLVLRMLYMRLLWKPEVAQ